MNQEINRLKIVLAEKRTNRWLAALLEKMKSLYQNGIQTQLCQVWII